MLIVRSMHGHVLCEYALTFQKTHFHPYQWGDAKPASQLLRLTGLLVTETSVKLTAGGRNTTAPGTLLGFHKRATPVALPSAREALVEDDDARDRAAREAAVAAQRTVSFGELVARHVLIPNASNGGNDSVPEDGSNPCGGRDASERAERGRVSDWDAQRRQRRRC